MVNKRLNVICILVLITSFIFPLANAFSIEDAIIAVINDDLVTLKDLKDYFQSIFIQMRLEGRSDSEIQMIMSDFREKGIEKLIEDRLILTEANAIGLEVNESIINEKVEKIRDNYASDDEFINALLADGSTITDLREKIRDQLKMNYIIDMNVKSKITINPQEVTEYYNANLDKFLKPEARDLESIYIPIADDPAVAKQKADEAYKLLKEGKDFMEVASTYSKTPSVGLIERGQLLSSVEEAVFNLEEGTLSPVIEVEGGFFIFKVKSKVTTQLALLEEVKDDVSNMLFQRKFKNKFKNWLAELKRDAFIEINQ